ncbi:MAG: oligosaccharide flippase family protein [Pseudomonadota bacterium]
MSTVLEPRGSRLRRAATQLASGDRPLFAMFRSVGTQALIVLMNVATGIITARLLGAEGRGVYVAITLWPPLLAMLATAGLNSGVVFRLRRNPGSADAVAGAALWSALVGSLLFIAAGTLLLPLFMTGYSAGTVQFAQLCLAAVAVNATQIVIKQSFAGSGQYWYCNLTHLLPQLFHLLALVAIMLFATVTAKGAALALFLSGAVAVLAVLPKFGRTLHPRFRGVRPELKELRSYSMRAAPSGLVAAFVMYSDRLVLIPLLSARELGFYAVAFSFSRVVQFVQPALQSILLSHMSGQGEAAPRVHDIACRFLFVCLTVACGTLWLAGEWLLGFAYGAEFAAAIGIFRLLIVEASLGVLAQVTVQLYLARDRPGVVSTIQIVTLAISLALLLTLVPRLGAVGAAIALLAAGVVRWLMLLGGVRGILKLPLPRLYLNREDWHYLHSRLRA